MNYDKNKRKSKFKKILSFFDVIITILIVIVCLIILIQRRSDNEKSFLGLRLFKVETGSMIPKYNINDVLLTIEKEPNEIKVGDDIVYIYESGDLAGMIVTHQVIRIEEDKLGLKFYTKGLANDTEDPVVRTDQIIGVFIIKTLILTLITKVLLNPYTLYFFIILPVTMTLFFREVHSKDVKERYVKRQIEKSKNKDDKNALIQKDTKKNKNSRWKEIKKVRKETKN